MGWTLTTKGGGGASPAARATRSGDQELGERKIYVGRQSNITWRLILRRLLAEDSWAVIGCHLRDLVVDIARHRMDVPSEAVRKLER